MVVAVVPILGRYLLVPHTIKRLNKLVDRVVCIVDNPKDRQIVADLGAFIVNSQFKPLGWKWNAGFWEAKQFNPDYVLYVGSGDWVSENWLDLTRYDAEIIGTLDYHLLHLDYNVEDEKGDPIEYQNKKHKFRDDFDIDLVRKNFIGRYVSHWKGYECERKGEPIGIGRLVRSDYLDRVGWRPFEDELNNNLDYSMIQKAKSVKAVQSGDVQSLAVSTSLWSNKHPQEGESISEDFLTKWFKEAFDLF